MPPIRNSCVARGTVSAAGGTVLYTVPAATVLLLKDVRLYNTSGTATAFRLQLNAPGVVLLDLADVSLAGAAAGGYSGWVALNAGDQVYAAMNPGVAVEYWLSGALLPQIPGF